MTADLLRQAAALMRERAEAVIKADDGDWYTFHSVSTPFGRWAGDEDAAHIAALTPAVALAVADWLDGLAIEVGGAFDPERYADVNPNARKGLAVARTYLNEVTS